MNIPALRGKIGDTIYYSANLSFKQIADLVKRIDSELHTSTSLKEEIQRSLSDNYIKIKNYILNRNDHFFNALVLAVYDGEPKWTEIRYELNDESFHNVGILEFNGEEKIFPVDGQHRVEGIKSALERKPELAEETICVMLIGHNNTTEGRERSRRIFSTLNRYAKPVKLGDIIALDEDDAVAIVTRDLLENYRLFTGNRIKATNSKSIPPQDKSAFTSLMTLYSCHIELFKLYHFRENISSNKMTEYLKTRPDDSVLSGFYSFLENFWNQFILHFPEVDSFINSNELNAAAMLRSSDTGGNILFRPISLLPLIEAITRIVLNNSDFTIDNVLYKYSRINRNVSEEPWRMIIWNPLTRRMIMRNQTLVRYLMMYMFDQNTLTRKELGQLYSKYALVHNITIEQAEVAVSQFIL